MYAAAVQLAAEEHFRLLGGQQARGADCHEQAKGEVSGQRQEKSAIGGGQSFGSGESRSQTGEPGRARDELGQDRSDADKARSKFDKKREPTSQR